MPDRASVNTLSTFCKVTTAKSRTVSGIATLSVALGAVLATALPATAAPVYWVDWLSGTAGANGSATGIITAGASTINVSYSGEMSFIQTNGGTNYWNPSAPYISSLVDNAPPTPDIIALSKAAARTLVFSEAVNNVFFAVVSLNGNGYRFNRDFDIVSQGTGYWGSGTLAKVDLGNGQYQLNGTSGEPHGVIRFRDSISSVTWNSLSDENWNGFTIGTYGTAAAAAAPEPGSIALLLTAGIPVIGIVRRRKAVTK